MSAIRVGVVLLVVSAGLGVGASRILAAVVAPPEPVERPRVVRADPVPPVPTVDAYLDQILGRSLFDASRIAVGGGPAVAAGSLTLLGTVVSSPIALSSALIADTAAPGLPETYSLGHRVHDRVVVSIGYDEVGLRRKDGTIEVLRWGAAGGGAAEPPAPTEAGIHPTGEGRYAVSRSVLTGLDPGALAGMARSQVHRGPDGEPDGFRLAALRKGSLPDQLGLQNGDVVHAVGDRPLTSAAEAMAAFGALQGEDEICVDLTRRGVPSRLCYTISPP